MSRTARLNSVPVDRPLYVFLHPGGMPRDAVARDADLAHVMTLEAAGSVAEVADSGYPTATSPIDVQRWTAIPGGGGGG